MRSIGILVIFFLMTGSVAHSQMIAIDQLDTARVYKSLDDALKDPEHVYRLDLTRSKLDSFPGEILLFSNLNELILRKNKLDTLPIEINQLKYLQRLDISKNELRHIPPGICDLTSLKELIISQNFIIGFPACIKQLTQLTYMDAYSNELGVFPQELSRLKSLERLDLRDILLTDKEQDRISKLLPHTKIKFSANCNCGF